ncbi:hypothetical protein [Dactylosporangium sp. CA-139066]|uniref:hypothetical protein n=1 Tax=Dactylosporangium sp. CA-139066 TaxID=3239930 RepID=UPI003D89D3DD
MPFHLASRPGRYEEIWQAVVKAFTHAAMRGPSAWSVADREPLRATLRMQVEDALAVCAAFDTTARLADAFGFEVLSPEGFEAGAKYLLKRGYK